MPNPETRTQRQLWLMQSELGRGKHDKRSEINRGGADRLLGVGTVRASG